MDSRGKPIFRRTLETGSEEGYDYVCTFCERIGTVKEADHYCANCHCLYCNSCYTNKHEDWLGHEVVNVCDWGELGSDICQMCRQEGKIVSKHCVDHDQSCCLHCSDTGHSSCSNVSNIDQMASSVYTSTDYHSLKNEVEQTIDDVQNMRFEKEMLQMHLKTSRQKSFKRLDDFRMKVDEIFKKLQQEAEDEFNDDFARFDDDLEGDIEMCDDILENLILHKTYIECGKATKPKMFMKLKEIRHKLTEYGMSTAMEKPLLQNFEEYEFNVNPSVKKLIDKIEPMKLNSKQQNEDTCNNTEGQFQLDSSTTSTALDSSGNQKPRRETKPAEKHADEKEQVEEENVQNAKEEVYEASNQPCLQHAAYRTHSIREKSTDLLNMRHSTDQSKKEIQEKKSQINQQLEEQKKVTPNSSQVAPTASHGGTVDVPPFGTEESAQQGTRQRNVEPKATLAWLGSRSTIPSATHRERPEKIIGWKYKIRLEDDDRNCIIKGMFGLTNGTILLSDYNNRKLKLIDRNYKVIDNCRLPDAPKGVCAIDDYQAVTALSNMTLQFVILASMELSKAIKLSHCCDGLAHYGGKFYVTKQNGKCVYVYDTSGNHLSSICEGDIPGVKFLSIQNVYITRDGARIYVADSMKGLVVLNANGTTLSTISPMGLNSAHGVCTDTSGNVYVSGLRSHNVFKFGERGTRALGAVVTGAHGIGYPSSIWFNSSKSQLLVSHKREPSSGDYLNVFIV